MDPRGLVVTKNAYLLLLTHIKQLLLVTLCNTTAGIGNLKVGRDANAAAIWMDRREGWNSYVDLMGFLIKHNLLISQLHIAANREWRCVVKNVMPQLFLSTGFSNPFLNVKILRGLSLITMTSWFTNDGRKKVLLCLHSPLLRKLAQARHTQD